MKKTKGGELLAKLPTATANLAGGVLPSRSRLYAIESPLYVEKMVVFSLTPDGCYDVALFSGQCTPARDTTG